MADVISRLRLDSGEFDSKIKRAGQELLAYSEHCKKMGLEMGYANKDAKDFAKALGDMKTVSQTARGKLNELTEAFTNLRSMYNNMTEDEKQNTFGKELAASLEKLKGRINDAKKELSDIDKELGKTKQAEDSNKSGIEALTSALGINVKSLIGWGTALAAGKAALDVAKDAFFASETNVDEWGRTVRSAEGIYQSFVQSLNTGDFTGFLNNIGRVTQAAQEAYNALDELGTRMTIINPERARLQARQQELRADIRRNGADSEVGKAALAELKKIEPLLSKSFKTESQMNYTAFEKLVRERMAEGGINLNQRSFEQFMKTFSSDAAFQNLRRNARGSSELRETSEIGKFRTVDTRNIEQKLLDLFTDEWRQANSGYLTASFSAQGAAASNTLGNARYMRAGSGGGKGGKTGNTKEQTELQQNQKKINDLTQQYVELSKQGLTSDDERLVKLREEIKELEKRNGLLSMYAEQAQSRMLLKGGDIDLSGKGVNRTMFGDLGITSKPKGLDKPAQLDDKALKAIQKNIQKQTDLQVKELKESKKEDKSLSTGISNLAGGMGSVVSGLEQLGIEIPDGFKSAISAMQGISSILTGIATTVLAIEAIAGADAIIPFANGGIVPHAASGILMGNSYSGDNIGNVRLNAGELVLNKAQQGNLAAQLTGGGLQNLQLDTIISGEDIRVVLNNNGRRTGRGEYITSRNRRV